MGRRRGGFKKPYPSQRNVYEAVARVALSKPLLRPEDFVEEVRRELESEGFYAGLVSARRVWSCYLNLVRRGSIPDVLDVVQSTTDEGVERPD